MLGRKQYSPPSSLTTGSTATRPTGAARVVPVVRQREERLARTARCWPMTASNGSAVVTVGGVLQLLELLLDRQRPPP